MLREILNMVLEQLDKSQKKDSAFDNKSLETIKEIERLEVKLVDAIADAERWGDLTKNSDWRTVEVNRITRLIEAKKRVLETLKRNN